MDRTETNPQALDTLHMYEQTATMMNRYEFFADDGSGSPGQQTAFAEQEPVKLTEEVTVHTGPGRQEVLTVFRARKAIDPGSGYEVTDGANNPIGGFRKNFGKSLLNSTWYLETPGAPTLTGRERSTTIAILRRLWGMLPETLMFRFPMRYHFDFAAENNPHTSDAARTALSITTQNRARDHYRIDITDPTLDRRLVIAQAIAIAALQSR